MYIPIRSELYARRKIHAKIHFFKTIATITYKKSMHFFHRCIDWRG